MKNHLIAILICIVFLSCNNKPQITQEIVSSDINNFWEAYDKINTIKDTVLQLNYLNKLFIDKASKGQKELFEKRNYKPNEYVKAINTYPKFWKTIRENTLNTKSYSAEIMEGITKFKEMYPEMKPAIIYYTMGVFRTPGTGFDDTVLIGSEFALGTSKADVSEFPERLNYVKTYYATNPIQNIQFLNVHEYVHTQQSEMVENTLSLALYEGIADFIAYKATTKEAPFPYVNYGKENDEKLRNAFEEEMFNFRKMGLWMWNANNQFKTRDLIYYIGFKIAALNYEKATDKTQAIKEMIELEYTNEAQVESFVNNSGYFSGTIEALFQTYQSKRPTVVAIKQFENESQSVSLKTEKITIEFSMKMSPLIKSTGFGPLGKGYFPKVNSIDFAEDGMSVTYHVTLAPNKQYQILLENGYRTEKGNLLKPYLIDFKTTPE
jgi:hypothetical protein